MDFTLNLARWNLAAKHDGDGTMLRFTDFVIPGLAGKNMDFGQRLDAIVEMEAKGDLYLDLEGVEYLYAADIGNVVRVWKRLKDEHRRLVLCNAEPFVLELFHITRLDERIEIRRGGPRFSLPARV